MSRSPRSRVWAPTRTATAWGWRWRWPCLPGDSGTPPHPAYSQKGDSVADPYSYINGSGSGPDTEYGSWDVTLNFYLTKNKYCFTFIGIYLKKQVVCSTVFSSLKIPVQCRNHSTQRKCKSDTGSKVIPVLVNTGTVHLRPFIKKFYILKFSTNFWWTLYLNPGPFLNNLDPVPGGRWLRIQYGSGTQGGSVKRCDHCTHKLEGVCAHLISGELAENPRILTISTFFSSSSS